VLAALLVLAGCGSSERVRAAAPGTRVLEWHDDAGAISNRVSVTVHRLTVRAGGWSVAATVTNRTGRTLVISRIHHRGGTSFGIEASVAGGELYATRFDPPLRRRLTPGDSWTGVFSGPGLVPRGRDLRIVFGTFFATPPLTIGGRQRTRFDVITDESVRLT
jgi:hypothetical protein